MTSASVQYVIVLCILLPVFSQDVGIRLESESPTNNLPNNAIISANNISGAGQSLVCFTNRSDTQNVVGSWVAPDGTVIDRTFSNTFYTLPGPGTAMLYRTRSVSAEQEGIYTCHIPDSNNVEHVLYVGIYRQDNFMNGTPVIPDPPTFNLLTPFDQFPPTFSLTCVSTQYPPTNVTWLVDDDRVVENIEDVQFSQVLLNSAMTVYENVIIITSNYSGEYTCEATNTAGTGRNTYFVTEPSGPPEFRDPIFLGSGDVNITWNQPEGEVRGYQLFYRLSTDTESETVINITRPNITHVVLRGLLSAATYNVSILSYADLPTERSEILSLTLSVADVVDDVTVQANSSTSLLIKWSHSGENVVRYIIYYEPIGEANCPGVSSGNVSIVTNITEYLLTGLEEYTTYNITISTVSKAAVGEPSPPVTEQTLTDSPGAPPTNITVVSMDPNSFYVSWDTPPCGKQNGPIINYMIQYTDLFVNLSQEFTTAFTNATLANTTSVFRNVSFKVRAITSGGRGPFSSPVYNHLIGNPGRVASLRVTGLDVTSISLAWNTPSLIEFVFSKDFTYTVSWFLSEQQIEKVSNISSPTINVEYTITGLAPNTTYSIFITPSSSYTPGISVNTFIGTLPLGSVSGFEVVQNNDSSVNVSWISIESRDIMYYEIAYNSTATTNQVFRVNNTQLTLVTIGDLDNRQTYDFTIAAVVYGNNAEIRSPASDTIRFTFSVKNNRTLVIIITCSCIGGLLLLIVVIIVTTFFLSLLSKNLGPQLANAKKEDEGYVPLDLIHTPIELNEVDAPTDKSSPPTITGVLTGDIHSVEGQEVVLKFEVSGTPKPSLKWYLDDVELDWDTSSFVVRNNVIVFKRVEMEHTGVYKLTAVNVNGSCNKTVNLIVYPDTEVTRHPSEEEAITTVCQPIEGFGQYVAGLHGNGNRLFREQFRMINSGEVAHPIKEVTEEEENRRYNRFQHIVVYDDNRIRLELLSQYLDCQHEYINACYVKSDGEASRKFIATQGPLEHSVTDMWRLVWQEKAPIIVMLTNTKEDLRIKCAQYWPSKGTEQYGPFAVKLLQETTFNGYITREFTVHYNTMAKNIRSRLVNPTGRTSVNERQPFSDAQSTLKVTQYQYIDWMEHGTVDNIASLLDMHHKATSILSPVHPIVVHCSNGVGRTGAFIALDMALEQCKDKGTVDVPAIVVDIRNQRMKMIQTVDQYMLVHDAVIEKIICGDNRIHLSDLYSKLQTLEQRVNNTNETGYEHQFNILEKVCVSPQSAVCTYAQQFPQRNQENHALPTNQWRVPLKGESPDYINATYVAGYNNDKGFIVTQGPMRGTRRDFWKLIHDYEITTIVMLSPSDGEVCAQYWPSAGNIEFGEFVVVVKDTTTSEGFTRRLLLLKENKSGSLRRVVQYQIDNWTDINCTSLEVVNTINLVATTQRKTPNIPVLVHCSNGFGLSAIFCVVMTTIERCKVEGMMDVFQLVKKVRTQLPGTINTKEQYRAIYRLVAAYLDLFSTSANFENSQTQ